MQLFCTRMQRPAAFAAAIVALAVQSFASVVDVSVRSKWPSTAANFVLETSEYLADEDTTGKSFWQFIDSVVHRPDTSVIPDASAAVGLAQPLLPKLTFEVLRLALGARAYSPAIEYQRQLALGSLGYRACARTRASDAASGALGAGTGTRTGAASASSASAGWADVVVELPGAAGLLLVPVCDASSLARALSLASTASAGQATAGGAASAAAVVAAFPGTLNSTSGEPRAATYDSEHWFPAATPAAQLSAEAAPLVLLYLAMDAPGAAAWHDAVRQAAAQGSARAILRHWLRAADPVLPDFDDVEQDPLPLGTSSSGSSSSVMAGAASPLGPDGWPRPASLTWLSGYGIGLDVKSTEYKVINEQQGDKDKGSCNGGAGADEADAGAGPASSDLLELASLDSTLAHILGLVQASHGTDAGASAAGRNTSLGVDWAALASKRPDKAKVLAKAKGKAAKGLSGAGKGKGSAAAADGEAAGSTAAEQSLLQLQDERLQPFEVGDLGLQATAVVLDAATRAARGETGPQADPLQALVTVSSNFPSLARSLSRVPVTQAVRDEVDSNQRFMQPGHSLMTVNGIAIDPTAPQFNLFSLFNILRAEARVIAQLDTLPLAPADRRRVQALAIKSGEGAGDEGGAAGAGGAAGGSKASGPIRIDMLVGPEDVYVHRDVAAVGGLAGTASGGQKGTDKSSSKSTSKGKDKASPSPKAHPYATAGHNHSIVSWLSDVETDPEFARWPTEIRGLMQPSWQLHQIRRNLYTTLAIVDLGTPAGWRVAKTVLQFSSMRAPIKFGLVLMPGASEAESAALAAAAVPGACGTVSGATSPGLPYNGSAILTGLQASQLLSDALLRFGPGIGRQLLRNFAGASAQKEANAEALAQQAARDAAEAEGRVLDDTLLASVSAPEEAGLLTVDEAVEAYAQAIQAHTGSWTKGTYVDHAKAALIDKDCASRAAVRAVARWVRTRGLSAPGLVVNGRVSPQGGAGPNFQQELMGLVSADMQLLQAAVYSGRIDDNVAPSVLHAFLGRATRLSARDARDAARRSKAQGPSSGSAATAAPLLSLPGSGTVMPRWHASILAGEDEQVFLPLSAPEARPLLSPSEWSVGSVAAGTAGAATTTTITLPPSLAYLSSPGTLDEIKPVSLTLVDDLDSAPGLANLAGMLAYVRGVAPVASDGNSSATVAETASPCVPLSGLLGPACPVPVAHLAHEISTSLRVGALHVPQLRLTDGEGGGGGDAATAATASKEPATLAVRTIGEALSVVLPLIAGSHPSVLDVRSDSRGPAAAAVVDVARGAVLGTATVDATATAAVSVPSGTGPALARFVTLLASLVTGPQAPLKPAHGQVILDVLQTAVSGVPLVPGPGEVPQTDGADAAADSTTDDAAERRAAVRGLLLAQRRGADIARRLLPEALPATRQLSGGLSAASESTGSNGSTAAVDASGLAMRIRGLAANGRLLSLLPLPETPGPSTSSGDATSSSGPALSPCETGDYALPNADTDGKAVLSACVGPEDVAVMVLSEKQARGTAVASLLQTCDFSSAGVEADDLTTEWMSGVVQTAASAVGASLTVQSGSAGGRGSGRTALRTEVLAADYTAFTSVAGAAVAGAASGDDTAAAGSAAGMRTGSSSTAGTGLYVTAVIDPASEDAQRYAPLLLMLRDRLGATVRVHLNPGRAFNDLPVRSFFRYVLPAPIPLPAEGSGAAGSAQDGAAAAGTAATATTALSSLSHPRAVFSWLPPSAILTLKLYAPEPWNTQLAAAAIDTDNMKLNGDGAPPRAAGAAGSAGSGGAAAGGAGQPSYSTTFLHGRTARQSVTYEVRDLLAAGQCVDGSGGSIAFPNGLQLTLEGKLGAGEAADGDAAGGQDRGNSAAANSQGGKVVSDTLVMQNLGYWQLKAQPGVWSLRLAEGRARDLYSIIVPSSVLAAASGKRGVHSNGGGAGGRGSSSANALAAGYAFLRRLAYGGSSGSSGGDGAASVASLDIVVRDFTGPSSLLMVRKRPGKEHESLLAQIGQGGAASGSGGDGANSGGADGAAAADSESGGIFGGLGRSLFGLSSGSKGGSGAVATTGADGSSGSLTATKPVVHVFSLASGALYERFLKIMMLAAIRASPSVKLKFWLVENFLSPGFKAFAPVLAANHGAEVAFVTYKWPAWLRGQSEKQRIIWGYKILFLDVLFPLNVSKIIYIDADQVVRSDLSELWSHDLEGAPYAYTPFCDSRKETLGYQFWREGYWKDHLRGRPYHISALYVVDLDAFRRSAVGDNLRSIYDQLSRDPASLSNLDQDLPNYAQHAIPIHSLPQEWLWCESWCSDDSKASSKTIDLCNNPRYKEPKLDMARRVIDGPLFPSSWDQLDSTVASEEAAWRDQRAADKAARAAGAAAGAGGIAAGTGPRVEVVTVSAEGKASSVGGVGDKTEL